ncbi:hypothetical protein PUNSTDRAFT_52310 [Punctularia strigosozonata HHB-11173 SS5]|uniref:uncharacterized protein n=1 Tax=Punctularia strigosozonata (strain HHB-11173) TaxID=741275 RepID=UPI0004417143|nr:uncharacterized protein PUNSTDRAFT_52310 [Punctularia strigosozonata HHB-11173 SS5]EIN08844.1 hypothetical protein PUNSTDRAFT_52310 [Punctularia strigosozonata HHB-11173 SS5]
MGHGDGQTLNGDDEGSPPRDAELRVANKLLADLERLRGDAAEVKEILSGQLRKIIELEKENRRLQERLKIAEKPEFNRPRVVCLIDGDGAIFTRETILQGRNGAFGAIQSLLNAIRRRSEEKHPNCDIWVHCVMNKRGLTGALQLTHEIVDTFIAACNRADPRCFMVDVGTGKEAADHRIKHLLRQHAFSPHCPMIFFGGCHDNGYAPDLRTIITAGLRHKLIMLPGYSDIAAEIQDLQLPEERVDGLFEPQKILSPRSRNRLQSFKASPLPPTAAFRAEAGDEDLESVFSDGSENPLSPLPDDGLRLMLGPGAIQELENPVPESSLSPVPRADDYTFTRGGRMQEKPCGKHYLLGHCPVGNKCQYYHDVELNERQIELLRSDMKRRPCRFFSKNGTCKAGEKCIFGHQCPEGARCSKDNCPFGRDAHPA